MSKNYDCLCLFSAGLDSILAAKVLERQGLRVKCLHFTSPFFGKPRKIGHWREVYGLDIERVDAGEDFVRELPARPRFGLGKALNPCVDCKVFMAGKARKLLSEYGATFIASGEVVGQRPMSQRRDAMNIVTRESGTRDLFLRPLCARKLPPTPMEESGLVDREQLLNLGGRGRKGQLALAEEFGLAEIPTPAGGCLLTEPEACRRFAPLIRHLPSPGVADFELAGIGRQYWSDGKWLAIGRNQSDNKRLAALARDGDVKLSMAAFPGPIGVGRQIPGLTWDAEDVKRAAAFFASFSPKARKAGSPVEVRVSLLGKSDTVTVTPSRDVEPPFLEPGQEELDLLKQEIAGEFASS